MRAISTRLHALCSVFWCCIIVCVHNIAFKTSIFVWLFDQVSVCFWCDLLTWAAVCAQDPEFFPIPISIRRVVCAFSLHCVRVCVCGIALLCVFVCVELCVFLWTVCAFVLHSNCLCVFVFELCLYSKCLFVCVCFELCVCLYANCVC